MSFHAEISRRVYMAEYGRARDLGLDPKKAHEIAKFEARQAIRPSERVERHTAPTRADSQIPHAGFQLVYDANREGFVKTAWIRPEEHGIAVASPFDPAREEEHKRFGRAEKWLHDLVSEETGVDVGGDNWLESKAEREARKLESHRMANKLECGGTQAYRTDEYQLYMCSVFTGHVEQIPNFRRICFIPQIAAMVRAAKVASLEYFLQCHLFCRFWTFTSGKRVGLSGLHERIKSLHKRLNKLNKELKRRYGVSLVFRSTELGTIETAASAGKARARRSAKAAHRKAAEKAKAEGKPAPEWTRAKDSQFADDSGKLERDEVTKELMLHPHAHCVLYMPNGPLSKEKWSEMLSFVWKHWGDHWDDGAVIQDAREACKYVTKSGEIDALSPAEACALEKALHGLRLVTPMGVLKKEIRARKDRGQKLHPVRRDGGSVWTVIDDPNKQLSKTEEEKEGMRLQKRNERHDRIDATNVLTNPVTGEVVNRGLAHAGAPRRVVSGAFCRVVARIAPAAIATPRKEPRVMVIASRGAFDMGAVRRHPLFEGMWQAGAASWFSADPIRVHESTPTGEQRVLTLLHDTDERFAPPGNPVWEDSKPVTPMRSEFAFSNN